MSRGLLPPWLPEWDGAEAVAEQIDTGELEVTIENLGNLVFAEDTVFLDSLPEIVESALVTPLSTLMSVHSSHENLTELIVAARLVRRSIAPCLDMVPQELLTLIQALPE